MALSILVGAFGYTLVDKALEDRVTALESKVDGLYYAAGDTKYDTTRKSPRNDTTWWHEFSSLSVGMSLELDRSSYSKFLLRKSSDDTIQFIRPTQLDGWHWEDEETTQPSPSESTYYLYINDSSATLTAINVRKAYDYSHDNDYSAHSRIRGAGTLTVELTCRGYTDPTLAGLHILPEIKFSILDYTAVGVNITSNTIAEDGSFEYSAIYTGAARNAGIPNYRFTDIKIK